MPVLKGLHSAIALDYHYELDLIFWAETNLKVIRVVELSTHTITGKSHAYISSFRKFIFLYMFTENDLNTFVLNKKLS